MAPVWDLICEHVEAAVAGQIKPTILDLASGAAEPACSIASRLPTARVISTDSNAEMLKAARNRVKRLGLGARVTVKRLDMLDLSSISTDSVDVVTVCLGLHLIPDALPRVLGEITRVLKPGGHCIGTMWDDVPIVDACCRTMEDLTREPGASFLPADPFAFACGRMDPLLATAGLTHGLNHGLVKLIPLNLGLIDSDDAFRNGPLSVLPRLAHSPPREMAAFRAAFRRRCQMDGLLSEADEICFTQRCRLLAVQTVAHTPHTGTTRARLPAAASIDENMARASNSAASSSSQRDAEDHAEDHAAAALAGLVCASADDGRSTWGFHEFHLRSVAGKGLGAFALRSYAVGERIFAERPLAVLVVADRNRVLATDGEALIESVVSSLAEWRRAAYYALSQEEWHGAEKCAVGIWQSNAYPLDEEDGGGGCKQAVFEQICRLNHSCSPNVAISWSAKLRRQTVHAIRPICNGEELTSCFYGTDGLGGMQRDERREHLHTKMHFECACDLCQLRGESLAQSEERQRRLQTIKRAMDDAGAPPAYERMRTLVLEAVDILREEGLPASWAKSYLLRLVVSAADTGNAELAESWARKAAVCAREACGVDSAAYRAILQ